MAAQLEPAMPIGDRLLDAREVASRLHVSPKTVRRYVEHGHLPAVRLTPTAQLRFRQRDVDAVIERGTKENA